jgi:hypothetical protein
MIVAIEILRLQPTRSCRQPAVYAPAVSGLTQSDARFWLGAGNEEKMSTDKQALETYVDDLWRIANDLQQGLYGSDLVRDVENLNDAIRELGAIASALRRRNQLPSGIASQSVMPARHIAAPVDLGLELNGCRPTDHPYSTDPVHWARAFLNSGDCRDGERTYRWFSNAMHSANPDAPDREDSFWDDFPTHPHGRPPSA